MYMVLSCTAYLSFGKDNEHYEYSLFPPAQQTRSDQEGMNNSKCSLVIDVAMDVTSRYVERWKYVTYKPVNFIHVDISLSAPGQHLLLDFE